MVYIIKQSLFNISKGFAFEYEIQWCKSSTVSLLPQLLNLILLQRLILNRSSNDIVLLTGNKTDTQNKM